MRPENRQYFAEIDGLRAIAVLSVLLFHLGFTGLSGGFIGVDVFFVISGFLITRNIVEDVATGRFSFSIFYYRRFRRLFPALCFTIVATLLLGVLLFSPGHLERLSKSAIYALFSLSNFYFWGEAGYFDVSSSFKPLLHFWSLAVEEQFYMVWPATLLLLLSFRGKFYLILSLLGIGVVSLVTAQVVLHSDMAAAFYLTPFRIVEFAIGALCVWCLDYRPNRIMLESGLILGFSLILFGVLTYNEQTAFPGINSLIPSFGAALVILSCKAPATGIILRLKPVVRIGLISYSLYLVHWPVLVYYSYWKSSTLSIQEKLMLLALFVLLAELMYRNIELRFRYRSSDAYQIRPLKFVGKLSLLLVAVTLPAFHIALHDGWTWRIGAAGLTETELSIYSCRNSVVSPEYERKCTIGAELDGQSQVLLLGDSHAEQFITAFDYFGKKVGLKVDVWTFPGCLPLWGTYKIYGANSDKIQDICKELVPKWETIITSGRYSYIVLAGRWMTLYEPVSYGDSKVRRDYLVDRDNPKVSVVESRKLFRDRLERTLEKVHQSGAKAILFSQVPPLSRNIQDCNEVPGYLISTEKIKERCDPGVKYDDVMRRLEYTDNEIRKLSSQDTLVLIPSDYICDADNRQCRTLVDDNLIYKDSDHLSKRGSLIMAMMLDDIVTRYLHGNTTGGDSAMGF